MAKTNNKYSSINFNHLYEKHPPVKSNPNITDHPIKTLSSSSASFSYSTVSSSNKTHGRMLVLTRPNPKRITTPQPKLQTQQSQPNNLQTKQTELHSHQPQSAEPEQVLDQPRVEPGPDSLSLRPLGRTGTGSLVFSPAPSQERDKESSVPVISPKPDKFVPPHLRPGFTGRKERLGPEVIRAREAGQKQFGSPNRYVEGSRPKSGGGHERIRGDGELDLGMMNRPRSSGNRLGCSG